MAQMNGKYKFAKSGRRSRPVSQGGTSQVRVPIYAIVFTIITLNLVLSQFTLIFCILLLHGKMDFGVKIEHGEMASHHFLNKEK